LRELQREINSGLNVVESWNGANGVISYGKGGGLATNRRDEQEMVVACLRILQAALVYVNTLMLQDVLDDPTWNDSLTADADRRALTPLFWSHVLPYGEVRLDMTSRLTLTGEPETSARSPEIRPLRLRGRRAEQPLGACATYLAPSDTLLNNAPNSTVSKLDQRSRNHRWADRRLPALTLGCGSYGSLACEPSGNGCSSLSFPLKSSQF